MSTLYFRWLNVSCVTLAAVLTPPLDVELFSPASSKCCSAESTGILDDLLISCAIQCLSPIKVHAVAISQICDSHPHLPQKDVFSHVSGPRSPQVRTAVLISQLELTTVLSPCP